MRDSLRTLRVPLLSGIHLSHLCPLCHGDLLLLYICPCPECTDVGGIYMLNYGPELVPSDPKILQPETQDYPFPQEKWFFINGVMVGTFWLESAINELSRLFEREVTGIRNVT